ncbi:acyl-CoA N-acyltransferase [Mycena galericulata]|nr:acyl-CoA N-acyltransferase [Mycena galericulata]
MSVDLTFKPVPSEDLPRAIKIENDGFPPDEAATLEAFQLRQRLAKDLFLGAYQRADTGSDDRLVGYVCSTLSSDAALTHESMATHVPGASSVCIHSVCISPACQRQGVGLKLLREYIARLETSHREKSAPYKRVLLITHEYLRPFYEKAGFEWVGRSAVVHGSQPWYEMRIILGSLPSLVDHTAQPPPGVLEALQRPSDNIPASRLLSSFIGGITDVSVFEHDTLVNKFDLLCPRSDCGSVILKSGVAKLIEAPSVQIEPAEQAPHSLLPALPPSPTMIQCWLITPSPMEFENIGFSHAVELLGDKMKLLACAECDLGPLGWCKEGGNEFWLACSRVGYRA